MLALQSLRIDLALTPAATALLLLAALVSLVNAVIAVVAVWGRAAREFSPREYARMLAAMAIAALSSAVLAGLGLLSSAGPGGGPACCALWWLAAAGLGCAAVPPALGALLGGALAARGGPPERFLISGQLLSGAFVWWLPKGRKGGNGAGGTEEEPEFEITMASGEEVEAEERVYIENILELGDTTADEVMTPRTDVVALDVAWDPERALEAVAAARFSRFPVYEGSIDNVVGVLHLRELLEYLAQHNGVAGLDLRALVLEPTYIPASRKVDDALRDLQRRKGHLAIVLDEYGGTAGILTIEDLLEEIVGEIQDEYDEEGKHVHQREDGSWVVSAQLKLGDFNDQFGAALSAEDVDTLGGYISSLLGRIPKPRECVERAGWRLTVLSVARNRIGRVLVERLAGRKGD